MKLQRDRVMAIVQNGGGGLAYRLTREAVPGTVRETRHHCTFELLLQVEHGVVALPAKFAPEARELPPGIAFGHVVPPAPQRDGNDVADARMQAHQWCECLLGNPVDGQVGCVPGDVGDDGQRMHDIAERRRPYDEDAAHGLVGRRARQRT